MKMKAQYISLHKKSYSKFLCSTFEDYETVDSFLLTIVDLSSKDIWKTSGISPTTVDCINDLKALGNVIKSSKKQNIIFILPNNIDFTYCETFGHIPYTLSSKMSETLPTMKKLLMDSHIIEEHVDFRYERNKTSLTEDLICESDFYFEKYPFHKINSITVSNDSEKFTSIYDKGSGYAYTFLKLKDEETILAFLSKIGISIFESDVPSWLKDIDFFDDGQLKKEILSSKNEIAKLNNNISNYQSKLLGNQYYKEMLIHSGNELVERVFKTMEELLDIDLSSFVDECGPDFVFEKNEHTFVGEIKGINTNVKNANISQINVHEATYIDELEESGHAIPPIKKLLIINHQRSKPLAEREPIGDKQITLARKDGVLIVETITLIKILEKYRKNELSSLQVCELLVSNSGLLSI